MAEPTNKKRRVVAKEGEAHEPQMQTVSVRDDLEQCINLLNDQMRQVSKLKKEKKPVETLIASVLMLMTDLRRLIRMAFENSDKASTKTEKTKEQVDKLHLQLQNLLYEKVHIQNETARCHQFKSRHDEIELIPEEDFLREEQDQEAELRADPHKLMLKRLDHEDRERKRLAKEVQVLREQRDSCSKINNIKQDQLQSLPSYLIKILEVAAPMESILGGDTMHLIPEDSPAKFLPAPLYVLFTNLSAYQSIEDSDIKISLDGNTEEARELLSPESIEMDTNNEDQEDAEGEEGEDEAGDEPSSRRETGKLTSEEAKAAKRAKLIEFHPLSVLVSIPCPGDINIKMQFRYLRNLKVITVTSEDETVHNEILSCLYPSDTGLELPNPVALYAADNIQLESFSELAPSLGRAYKWAQVISGVEVVEGARDGTSRLKRQSLVQVLKDIGRRVVGSKSLARQLQALGSHKIPLPSKAEKLFPLETRTTFESWTNVSKEDEELRYEAVFTRKIGKKQVSMKAIVTVPRLYPLEPPLFRLSMTGSDQLSTDANVIAIEAEVNIYYEELAKDVSEDILLSLQMRRVQMCFDIYCETEIEASGTQAGIGKMFIRGVRGRERLRPYLFDHQQSLFVHRTSALKA